MAKNFTGSGKESTFGRNLMNYVAAKLPYSGYSAIDLTSETNPKFKYFENMGSRRAEVLSKHSISQSNDYNEQGVGEIGADSNFSEMMYANVQKDKDSRIQDYRVMAAFAEVSDALDEICDEIINIDDQGEIVKLHIDNRLETELSAELKTQLTDEFHKYIQYYELDDKGWNYFRDVLIEGEVYFEHIMHSKHPAEGVLGIVRVPSELIDPIYTNIQNMLIKGFLYRKPIMEPDKLIQGEDFEFIPLDSNQIVYSDSGIWNENKSIKMPLLKMPEEHIDNYL